MTAETPETPPTEQQITLNVSDRIAKLLAVLVDEDQGLPGIKTVILEVIDHVQQGIYRPGSWERGWLEQVFGDSWQARLEPDPDSPFDRPIPPAPTGPPARAHHAYGVDLSAGEFEDEPVIGAGHVDPRRFVAACSSLARAKWGLWRLSDITRPDTIYAAITHRWAVWARDYPDDWQEDWTVSGDTPGAWPVTVLVPTWEQPSGDAAPAGTEGS